MLTVDLRNITHLTATNYPLSNCTPTGVEQIKLLVEYGVDMDAATPKVRRRYRRCCCCRRRCYNPLPQLTMWLLLLPPLLPLPPLPPLLLSLPSLLPAAAAACRRCCSRAATASAAPLEPLLPVIR